MTINNVFVQYNGVFLPDIFTLDPRLYFEWVDGTIAVYYYYPFNYVLHCLLFCYVRCPCMAINVSVQYNEGLLPDITLLAQCYYPRGTRLNAMKRFCLCSLRSHLNVLTFSPLTGGCSEGLDAFINQ